MKLRLNMKYKILMLCAILCTLFIFSSCSFKNEPKTYSITILETNDIHGRFDTMPEYTTIIKKIRKDQKNVLLLDAGDVFKRGPYEEYHGKIEMDIEDSMKYDAMVLGNNEFKVPGSENSTLGSGTLAESDRQIRNLIAWAKFPILCGNVKITGTGKYIAGTKPYIIKEVNGLKIGIIGITSTSPKDEGLEMTSDKDFIEGDITVKQLLPELKKHSDIQIVLSHAGMDINKKIMGVSAIISGHDHIATFKPEVSHGIPIIQAGGEDDHYLGRLNLSFKRIKGKWALTNFNGKLYSAEGRKKDPVIQKIIDKYEAKPIPTTDAS